MPESSPLAELAPTEAELAPLPWISTVATVSASASHEAAPDRCSTASRAEPASVDDEPPEAFIRKVSVVIWACSWLPPESVTSSCLVARFFSSSIMEPAEAATLSLSPAVSEPSMRLPALALTESRRGAVTVMTTPFCVETEALWTQPISSVPCSTSARMSGWMLSSARMLTARGPTCSLTSTPVDAWTPVKSPTDRV